MRLDAQDGLQIEKLMALAIQSDNIIETFIMRTGFRGRIVRLGKVLDEILQPHFYPQPLNQLTAEAAMLAGLLSSMLKFEGTFTLQAQGDGPVAMVVADITTSGSLRACATIREGRADELNALPARTNVETLIGKGYLAFTVDQGTASDRYQGIVELRPGALIESVQDYFRQSEQISTGIRIAIAYAGGQWRGGGILLQRVPEEGGHFQATAPPDEDAWNRAMMLLGTCTDSELTDPALDREELLYRLFAEEGIRAFEPQTINRGCRCTRERLEGILATMPDDDLRHMADEGGTIVMTCQFCSYDFKFGLPAIEHVKAEMGENASQA